ncbi:MAG: ribonuclease P protein component [Oscillospiraceae bacterium]|nr:ribonuclease P protein component [Oscillospiraceae bacterium]
MEIIKQNRDFLRIFGKGKCAPTKSVVVYACRSRAEGKYAVVAGKKVGGAVQRNRAKRLLRAAFYEISKENSLKRRTDFIFVARSRTPQQKMAEVKSDMEQGLKKLGMI